MTKNEFKALCRAQKLLCDIETTELSDKEYNKWNEATLIIADLLEWKEKLMNKKRGF